MKQDFTQFFYNTKLLCETYEINNWSIYDDVVNVDDNVFFYNTTIKKFPFKFGYVTGYFYCVVNDLTTLEGFPSIIDGYVTIHGNKISKRQSATLLNGIKGGFNTDLYWKF